jgi:hypothetical protein
MRRILTILIIIAFLLLACQAVTLPLDHVLPTATPLSPTAAPTLTPSPGVTPAPEVPTPPPPAPTLASLPDKPFTVRFHPDGGLYVGDLVSLEIIAPPDVDLSGRSAQVQVDGLSGAEMGPEKFEHYGIGGRFQATLLWAWNTAGLQAGDHTLTFRIQPDGPTWKQVVTLQPISALPQAESGARWAEAESQYCVVHYITGTAAERDLTDLLKMADEQAQDVSQHFHAQFKEPIPIVFVPRVLGHGGFTTQEIYISYLDRNYAGSTPAIVLHHEMVHLMDAQLGGDLRPTLLVEGLAVYLSGGHFKLEALLPRAAALLDLGWYLPLAPLADDFYTSQHEIGYLEAGSLIEYMVDTWGWDAFSKFYRDIHPDPNGSQAKAIDNALEAHFNLSFSGLEERYLQNLRMQNASPELQDDVRLTIRYYNTVRRYQQALDPSAYFLSAWLPDGHQMRQRRIVADYLRHPDTDENVALETMLVDANTTLFTTQYTNTRQVLAAVNTVLDAVAEGDPEPFVGSALAEDYYAIMNALDAQGYDVQRIQVSGSTAQAWVTPREGSPTGPEMTELGLFYRDGEWLIETGARINPGLQGPNRSEIVPPLIPAAQFEVLEAQWLWASEQSVKGRRTVQVQVIESKRSSYNHAQQDYQTAAAYIKPGAVVLFLLGNRF